MAKDKKKKKQDSSKIVDDPLAGRRPVRGHARQKALNTSWKAATGKNPPANPADPDVDVWEAVLWATVSGTADRARPDARHEAGGEVLRQVHRPPAAGTRKDDQDADAPTPVT